MGLAMGACGCTVGAPKGWGAGLYDPPSCMEYNRVCVYSEPRCVDQRPFNCAYIPFNVTSDHMCILEKCVV